MATPAQRTNTWTLDEWYDQAVAGTTGGYAGIPGMFLWGVNAHGQLGQNETTGRSSPVQVPGTTWKEFTLSGSYASVLATKTDGTLWSWGHASYGETLGQNQGTIHLSSPTQIGTDTNWAVPRSGGRGASALKTDGTLWVWGINASGALGLNQTYDASFRRASSPTQIPGSTWSTAFQGFSGGATSRGGVKTDGTLWTWGRGDIGQLGINKNSSRSSPTQVGTDTDWSKVEMGEYFGLAIKSDSTLWGFGQNGNGQLGQNSTQSPGNAGLSSPVQIPGTTWTSVFTDYGSSVLATKSDGTIWSWGYNGNGQLGQNDKTQYSSPSQIPGTWKTDTSQGMMNAGDSWGLALRSNGSLWSWGYGRYGQSGRNISGNPSICSSPIQIAGSWSGNATTGGKNATQFVSGALANQ